MLSQGNEQCRKCSHIQTCLTYFLFNLCTSFDVTFPRIWASFGLLHVINRSLGLGFFVDFTSFLVILKTYVFQLLWKFFILYVHYRQEVTESKTRSFLSYELSNIRFLFTTIARSVFICHSNQCVE